MIRMQRILFPTDFSNNSKCAEEYACEFARLFQAELHMLHVLEDLAILAPPPTMFTAPKIGMDRMREESDQALAKLSAEERSQGLRILRETRIGSPLVEIVRYARDKNIDLIILGTHGRTGLNHVLMGSVAENVVRKATCPVLTVRPSGHHFVMP